MITPLIIIITGLLWSFPLIAAQVVVPDPQWHPNNVGDWGILGECITFWDSCINRYNPGEYSSESSLALRLLELGQQCSSILVRLPLRSS
jgi:hypothetical protein